MSTGAKKTDAERTAIMLDLIHRRYESRGNLPPGYVVIEEVAPGTGWGASRYADVMALSVWKSNGWTLDGFEIKSSRTDLRRELADPSKHLATARYCDSWTLVIWDAAMIDGLTIPETWGILAVVDDALVKVRKPAKLTPLPWPREFICSLVRNASQQSPRAQFVARACLTASQDGVKHGRDVADFEWDHTIRPLAIAMWGKNEYQWPSADPEKIIAAAIALIKPPELRLGETIAGITGVKAP